MTSSSPVAPRRRPRLLFAAGVAASVLLAACGGGDEGGDSGGGSGGTAAEERNENLTFATGGTGGVYYPYGGCDGPVLSEKLEGITATAQETNASVDNVLLVQDGGADIAFALGDTVADAVAAGAQFEGREITVCTLGKLYDNFTQTVTTSGTGIRTIADLRGKRVSAVPGRAPR